MATCELAVTRFLKREFTLNWNKFTVVMEVWWLFLTCASVRELPWLERILNMLTHSSCQEDRCLEGRPSRLQTGTLSPCFQLSVLSSPDVLLFLLFLLFFPPIVHDRFHWIGILFVWETSRWLRRSWIHTAVSSSQWIIMPLFGWTMPQLPWAHFFFHLKLLQSSFILYKTFSLWSPLCPRAGKTLSVWR